MKRAAQIVLEFINGALALILLALPILIPETSRPGSHTEKMIIVAFFYAGFIGLWASLQFSDLNDTRIARRRMLLHYFPLWAIPLYVAFSFALGMVLDGFDLELR
ncbi:MAG: hypothetical protein K0R17_1244 [Rariglobus sp.]|jgi:hypothetical protein|nr:hypothetical protein [Rariglobus sp.]